VLIALVLLVLALGGGWLWLRDSSLVAVKKVQVTGATGANAVQIRRALRASARTMTTLDVRTDQLRMAVSPYPIVKRLEVSTHFPHGLTIHVIEENPVGAVVVDGRTIPVAGDGTLLPTVSATGLPTIPLRIPPGGSRVSDPTARGAVAILGAAPARLLESISQVTTVSGHGLVVQVRNGPSLYFGDATELSAKWQAATAVLADPGSAGAVYIDVTDPERPAAGAGSSGNSGSGSNGSSGSSVGG
jgi:cell division protein FtsQ